jgi:hypothetical protein
VCQREGGPFAIEQCSNAIVGVLIDNARLRSPARLAARLPRAARALPRGPSVATISDRRGGVCMRADRSKRLMVAAAILRHCRLV